MTRRQRQTSSGERRSSSSSPVPVSFPSEPLPPECPQTLRLRGAHTDIPKECPVPTETCPRPARDGGAWTRAGVKVGRRPWEQREACEEHPGPTSFGTERHAPAPSWVPALPGIIHSVPRGRRDFAQSSALPGAEFGFSPGSRLPSLPRLAWPRPEAPSAARRLRGPGATAPGRDQAHAASPHERFPDCSHRGVTFLIKGSGKIQEIMEVRAKI